MESDTPAMIPVSLTSLLILGMFAGLGLLGVLWLAAVWQERREERRARRKVVLCRICGHIYDNPELDGQGYPKFDLAKAKSYYAKVNDKLTRLIQDTVKKWNAAGL